MHFMKSRRKEWLEYLNKIELFYEERLTHPLSESVYTLFGVLIFNPKKPLDKEVKTVVIRAHDIIY